ncbi:unnamed protein product [Nyctereutes procyonoides]|uniref:(raccoon dog) hypothetical protein n=1 Tax=Nyctereutes procyonoides TaxID=34880 RepID=A0A811YGG2_NYCPR|nr:unnamed protein product [Nyctereutes procyonoides]
MNSLGRHPLFPWRRAQSSRKLQAQPSMGTASTTPRPAGSPEIGLGKRKWVGTLKPKDSHGIHLLESRPLKPRPSPQSFEGSSSVPPIRCAPAQPLLCFHGPQATLSLRGTSLGFRSPGLQPHPPRTSSQTSHLHLQGFYGHSPFPPPLFPGDCLITHKAFLPEHQPLLPILTDCHGWKGTDCTNKKTRPEREGDLARLTQQGEAEMGPDPPPSLSPCAPLHCIEIAALTSQWTARGPSHSTPCTSFYRAPLLSGTPWDLARPSTWRASRVEPGRRTWRQGSRGAGRKASDSGGGLSPHPAEEPTRGENVAAEAKLSEAAERKRCPEGRGEGDRPVQELEQLRRRTLGWLVAQRHWPALLISEAHLGAPF